MFYQVDVFKQLKDLIPEDKILVPGMWNILGFVKSRAKPKNSPPKKKIKKKS